MQPELQERFTALNDNEAAWISSCLGQPPLTGPSLFSHCQQSNIDQASLIQRMGSGKTLIAIRATEKILGFPVKVGWPALRGECPEGYNPATQKVDHAAPAPTTKTKRTRKPRPPAKDPRTVVSVQTNPKREGTKSYDRYELWHSSSTVSDFLAAGGTRDDVRHDTETNSFVKLGPVL